MIQSIKWIASANAFGVLATGSAKKKLACGPGILVVAGLFAPSANAGTITEAWTVTGAGITGSGAITLATTGDPAVDDITGITGNFSTTNDGGFSGAISGLVPGSYSSTSPTYDALNPTYGFDNLFYPSGGAPVCSGSYTTGPANVFDDCGVDFLVTGGYEVNLFGWSASDGYGLYDGVSSSGVCFDCGPDNLGVPVTFTATAAPEPTTFLLLGTGLPGLAVVRFRKARRAGHSSNS
jgi:hypothetical protein